MDLLNTWGYNGNKDRTTNEGIQIRIPLKYYGLTMMIMIMMITMIIIIIIM